MTNEQPKFYGRRRGRGLSKALEKELTGLDAYAPPDADQIAGWQGPVWLEIGIGSGEHIISLAKANPDRLYIGAEPYLNGLLKAARDGQGLTNLRLYPDDVRLYLQSLPDACLDGLIILFPDPWPKRRHWQRRIIGPSTLPLFTRLIKPDGKLHIASDHGDYVAWILRFMLDSPHFSWQNNSPGNWQNRPDNWPQTRYEQKRLAGPPSYFIFTRNQ